MKKGFTLIELMVVISIIGILSVIAIPRFMNITKDAKIAQIQANRRNLQTAVHMYMAKKDKSPFKIVGPSNENGEDYDYFVNEYMGGKIPSLPGEKYNQITSEHQSEVNNLAENYIIGCKFSGYAWLITEEGNVYPMVQENEYGIKFDKF